nr:ABC transporter permease [Solidesulfovibrio sp.]
MRQERNGLASMPTGRRKIARQVVLPFRISLAISIKSIRVRFLRSLVTVASLVLAVAFLSFILAGTEVAGGVLATGDARLRLALQDAGYDLPA